MEMKNQNPHKRAAEEYGWIINKKPRTPIVYQLTDSSTFISKKEEPIFHDFFSVQTVDETAAAIRNENLYEEEEFLGISLRLTLYEDPWKIRKTLTNSDVDKLCRFLLKTHLVETHILNFWDADRIAEAKGLGTRVVIYDIDTGSDHRLTFKRWSSSNSYVFNNNWSMEFVKRRDLRNGDEIGMYWDRYYSSFCFSVLRRACRNGYVF